MARAPSAWRDRAVAGNQAALTSALNRAIAANIRSGAAWSNVQGWHDDVKDSAEPVEPPAPPVYTESPVNPCPGDNVIRWFGPVSLSSPGVTVAGADGTFSFADASGNIQYYGTVNGAVVINGGMTPFPVKAGDTITMAPTADFGTRPKFSYSLSKYG
jgi:hypothetical protein